MRQLNFPGGVLLSRCRLILPAFLAGSLAGYLFNSGFLPQQGMQEDTEVREEGYALINPLLECEKREGSMNVLIRSFKSGLLDLEADGRKSGLINSSAVYFRDMNNGPWLGINESLKFRPASLLKIPIAMAFYKAEEEAPGILARKLKFVKEEPLSPERVQVIVPVKRIQLGREYTVEYLIEAMLKYSDNQALFLLFGIIPDAYLIDLYRSLGVEKDVLEKIDGTLSIKSFATFYRILFNSSYLSRRNSEQLLRLLSESEFRDGLVAGVPSGTVVAHKFGEGGLLGGERQLQDCGIIYYPRKPYLLCVMAKGRSLADLESFIRSVSAYVHKQVSLSVGPGK